MNTVTIGTYIAPAQIQARQNSTMETEKWAQCPITSQDPIYN